VPLADPRAAELCAVAADADEPRALARSLLGMLRAPDELTEAVADWVEHLRADGVQTAVYGALRES
jgi:hypothetical protein